MIQIARRFPGYSHGNRWQCNDSIHCQPRLHRFGSCTEVRHQTALLQNAYVELYRDQTQTIGYSLAETRPARSFVFVCDKKVTGRWKSCWKLKDRRKGVGSEVDSRYIQSKIIKLLYCEAQGKGRARGGPRKVTQRSFMDGGWWMVDILSLMLYIKVGCHPPPTTQTFNST